MQVLQKILYGAPLEEASVESPAALFPDSSVTTRPEPEKSIGMADGGADVSSDATTTEKLVDAAARNIEVDLINVRDRER